MNRSDSIDAFLSAQGWQGATRANLAGDASFRRYERIFKGDRHAVLMDAPPDKEDVRPFLNVASYLCQRSLSAPEVLAADEANGLLLLEDLGDDLFARVLEREGGKERELYLAATDVLIDLYHAAQANHNADIPLFDMPRLLQQVALLPEWFLPLATGKVSDDALKKEYLELWRGALARLPDLGHVMVLYDFHAENLLWLPGRSDKARAGLLDFQDAMRGSPAYDMVSFLEDARRDVAAQTVQECIAHYLRHTGIERESFMAAYALMGAQRNCRIVGTFARLAVRDKKPRYLAFMPRVWRHVENDLAHPLLAPVKHWMDAMVKPQYRGELMLA